MIKIFKTNNISTDKILKESKNDFFYLIYKYIQNNYLL
jgi:hypothetical protein